MAGNAVIGALRVDLGLNSAQFQAGLKSAQVNLSNFGKTVAKGLGIVSVAAAGAAAALGYAVKGAIDHADELSKTSQKIGVSVEALSQLEYAAKLSDVSLEQLTTGLGKFSRAMVEAAGNSNSEPGRVFAALGVSVKDAAGNLRSNEQVFADVADRLSRMEDGALKTSIAMQLFGKSGAELIPLLNGGKAGLAAMAAEADRLGITMSGKTAAAAEAFNDTLTRIGAVLQGVTNKVMEAALPALQGFADLLASPEFSEAAQTFATTLITVFNGVAQAIVGITNAARDAFEFMRRGSSTVGMTVAQINAEIATTQKLLANPNINEVARERSTGYLRELQKMLDQLSRMDPVGSGASFGDLGQFGFGTNKPTLPTIDLGDLTGGATAAKTAIVDLMAGVDKAIPKFKTLAETVGDTLTSAFTGFADSLLNGVPAGEAFIGMLGNLAKQLADAAIGNLISSIFGGGGFGGLFNSTPKLGIDFGMGLYAKGGVTDRPAIFGDNGPEAAVPLPDGRSIPVTINGNQQQPVNNFYGVPSQPEVRQNNTGGYDYIFKEFEGRIKNNMAKGQYRGFGVTPGMKRT